MNKYLKNIRAKIFDVLNLAAINYNTNLLTANIFSN